MQVHRHSYADFFILSRLFQLYQRVLKELPNEAIFFIKEDVVCLYAWKLTRSSVSWKLIATEMTKRWMEHKLSRGTIKDALSRFPNQNELQDMLDNYGVSLFESNERMDLRTAAAVIDWMLEKDSMDALGNVWCKLSDRILSLDGILPEGGLAISMQSNSLMIG